MQAAEIELKFSVPDIARLLVRIEGLGLTLVTPRSFEANTLYDTPDRKLRCKRQVLRLREYAGRALVTHKRLADDHNGDVHYKTRIETESLVEDPDALAEIFTQLGYAPVFRYEKFRTEWEGGGGHLLLDETPIGVWAELEGPPAWIDSMRERLGVTPAQCTTESYGAMFLNWKARTHSPAEHLTFEEIQTVDSRQ
ncbi:MAG TPA: class IV adenylate cyclase [Acidobacteriaceae bacterium]|jgi:adenylate cyclase class 2|nr:class IV adenylate cyclase [Acidobacteriaceae bacterium]